MPPFTQAERDAVCEYLDLILHVANRYGEGDGDDVGVACIGFVQAMRTFDPRGGKKFKNHVFLRMVGAVADAKRDLLGKKGSYLRKSVENVSLDGLEENVGATDDGFRRLENREKVDLLLSGISKRSAYVLRERYLKDRELKDVGESLGVSESRVWQLEKEAVLECQRL